MTPTAVIKSYLYTTEAVVAASSIIDFGRTFSFYTCLAAIRSSLDNFFTFSENSIFAFNMPMHLHFSYCTHILYRLYLADDPTLDRAAITNTVDLLGSIDRLATLYAGVPKAIGMETDGSDIFAKGSEVLRGTVPMWRKTLEEAGAIAPLPEGYGGVGVGDGTGAPLGPMDLSPDGWLTDMLTMSNRF